MPITFGNEVYRNWLDRNHWQTTTGTININDNDTFTTLNTYTFNTSRWDIRTSDNFTVNFHVKEKEKEFDSDSKELDEFLAGYKRSKE